MTRQKSIIYMKIVVFLMFAIVIDCNQNTGITGGTTETTSAKLEGVIYNLDGSKAAGATVKLIASDANPFSGKETNKIFQTKTDLEGGYSVIADSNGLYNVCAQKSGMYSFTGSVHLSSQKNTEVDDTLKEPGSISGTALLSPRDGNTKIAIVVLGTNTYTLTVDTTGHFSIPVLAEGEYVLRFMTTEGDYMYTDTIVQVVSGKNTSLDHIVELSKYVVPTVESVSVQFDSIMMTVMVTWPKVDSSKVSGFTITRSCNGIDSELAVLGNQKQFYSDDVFRLNNVIVSYSVTVVGIDRSLSVPVVSPVIKIQAKLPDDSIQLDHNAEVFKSEVPDELKIDKNHNVYLSTSEWIGKFNRTGAMVTEFVMDSMFYLENYSHQIYTIDNKGYAYVSDCYRSKLYKLSPELKIIKSISVEKPISKSSIYNLSVDNNGIVYVFWLTVPNIVKTYDSELNEKNVDTLSYFSYQPYAANNDTVYATSRIGLTGYTINGKVTGFWKYDDVVDVIYDQLNLRRQFFRLSNGGLVVNSCVSRIIYKLDNTLNVIGRFYLNGPAYNCDGDDHLCYYDQTTKRVLFYKIP